MHRRQDDLMTLRPKRRAAGIGLALLIFSAMLPNVSMALAFTPTETEWLAWPEYCRARYVVSGAGAQSEFASRVSTDEIQRWALKLGDGWNGLHHYCAGLHKVNRALSGPPARRNLDISDAVGEFGYYLYHSTTPKTHPLYADALCQSCTALSKIGQFEAALKYCDTAIHVQPENGIGYVAKAMALNRQKRVDEAVEVLEKGNAATNGESAEIHYFLGLSYLDMKKYDLAQQHAENAYRLGYPLPGLRDRLKREGHPLL